MDALFERLTQIYTLPPEKRDQIKDELRERLSLKFDTFSLFYQPSAAICSPEPKSNRFLITFYLNEKIVGKYFFHEETDTFEDVHGEPF